MRSRCLPTMIKNGFAYVLCAITILLTTMCGSVPPKHDCLPLSLADAASLLDQPLKSLPCIQGLNSRDTILEGDEGVSWKAKAYYHQQELGVLAESDWVNKDLVSRVTICSPQLKEGNLFVGQRMKNIRSIINRHVSASPDGYLFLSHKKQPNVSIQLDISQVSDTSKIFYGVETIDDIPDSISVESIIIMRR